MKAWNNLIVTVDWADPINSPAEDVMDKVKVLYVKNLAAQVTEDLLTQTFSAYGEVEKAKKLKGFKNIFNIDMFLIQIEETSLQKYF